MNASVRILITLTTTLAVLTVGCTARPVASGRLSPRPPTDLTIAIDIIAAEGSTPEPARFVIEPGGQLRAATGAGATPDTLPLRTRRLTDAQVSQLYGMIVRHGLALPNPAVSPSRHHIDVTVIADDTRRTGRHELTDAEALMLVERCRQLARLDDEQ